MARFNSLLVALLLSFQASAATAQTPLAMPWQTDLDAARALAESQHKLLLVHFYTESCGPCKMLDATVFNQPTVAQAISANYIPVKLNANEFQATAERFGITRVPTDVVITPQGRVLERMVSPPTPMDYIGRMSGIAQQYRQQAGREFQTVQQSTDPSQAMNSAYAALNVAPGDNNTFTNPGLPEQQASVTPNPFASQGATGTAAPTYSAAAAAVPTPPEQPVAAPVAVTNPYTQPSAATNAVPPVEPPSTDRYASAPVAAAPAQPAAEVAASPAAGSPTVASAPQLPAGSPPLGFFGYCPVTMKKENRWQRGDARWGCYHRGRTYLFASAEKRDEFLAVNGDEYAPALSGIDPVLAIDEGKVEPGKQDFGIDYEGQFYLFSSEENLRKFWSQPAHYADGVRQAMKTSTDGSKYR